MPSQSELMPPGVEDLFTDTKYGVSFPDRTGCQMRFVHKGKDLGWYFNYNDYDTPRDAVLAAIATNKAYREKYKRLPNGRPTVFERAPSGTLGVLGVSGSWLEDKRRGSWSYRYQVNWLQQGNKKTKSFWLAADSTPDQFLHGYRTAIQFRAEWEALKDDFDPAHYSLWRSRRLYEPGRPLLPTGFFDPPQSRLS